MLLSSWLMNRASPQKFSGLYLASLALAEQEELVVRARSTLGALTKLSPLRNQFLGLSLVPLSFRKVSQLIPGGQQEGKHEVVHQVQGENSQR